MANRINLVGNVYGDFTVIEMLYGYKYVNNKPRTYCKCIDKNNCQYIIRCDALRSGATKHINGVGKKCVKKDLTNQKFGHLTATYPTQKKSSNGSIIWHCKCDCGNEIDVPCGSLLRGHTRSCGCNHRSKWEQKIDYYLRKNNIRFETQKRFENCRNLEGTDKLPFDFYIPDYSAVIEYDGEHHFIPIKGWGGDTKFAKTKLNDTIKNNFCEDNNIRLLRIPYTYSENEIYQAINDFLPL